MVYICVAKDYKEMKNLWALSYRKKIRDKKKKALNFFFFQSFCLETATLQSIILNYKIWIRIYRFSLLSYNINKQLEFAGKKNLEQENPQKRSFNFYKKKYTQLDLQQERN